MKRKKRTRRGREESREAIMKAAFQIIEKEGWSGLSFQMIAKKCRMSTSNILYHFQSRESLLMEMLNLISHNNWRIVAEGVKPDFNAEQRLRNHMRKNLEWAEAYPQEAQVILQIYAEAAHNQNFNDLFQVMIRRAEERILEPLLAGQREGLFHLDFEPAMIARHLHSMLVGNFIKVMGSRLAPGPLNIGEDWEGVIRLITGVVRSSSKTQ